MKSKVFVLSIFAVFVFCGYTFNRKPVKKGNSSPLSIVYNIADSAYTAKNYALASTYFHKIKYEFDHKLSNPEQFKYAYSLYRNSEYEISKSSFESLSISSPEYLTQYTLFFKIKNLWQLDPAIAAKHSENFVSRYQKTALADSLLLPLADYFYQKGFFIKARNYYQLYSNWDVDKNKRAYVAIQSAWCMYRLNKKQQARDEFIQILRKYSSKSETLDFVKWLGLYEKDLYKTHFFNVIDVYFDNHEYASIKEELEEYIKSQPDNALKEKARFYLVKLYYAKGQNNPALYGFKNMLENLKNKSLEPSIRIYIARIYLRQGQKQQAIDSYLDYAHRFPRRRLAPEAVWKAAWVSEELQDLAQAQTLYQIIRKRWPNSSLAKEAYFREGFTYFRLGKINYANNVFNEIRFKRWPDVHRNRAQYWASLCSDLQKDPETARNLRLDLARNLWDDYYTMKSYLMHKSDFDSNTDLLEQFEQSSSYQESYASGFSSLLDNFEEAFEVNNVLGEQYAFIALEDIKLVAKSKDEWIALAEIYKKLKAYGKAFRAYDYINKKFFAEIPYTQKTFILKERFPYYYDAYVQKYSNDQNIEPELVLALMKQESVFDFKAHSWADAYGLMQLIPATAKAMSALKRDPLTDLNQLFNPEYNIKLGTQYLKQLSKRFNGQKELVLAAYNAGPHRVSRWKKLPGSDQTDVFIENVEYDQTRDYVRKVMKNYWAYKLLQSNFRIESDKLILGSTDF
jgi:soluble lytic murein transglycosylase-like protein/TolA-binding protein